MMKKFRHGEDIPIRWDLTRLGSDDLGEGRLSVVVVDGLGHELAVSCVREGSAFVGVLSGADQFCGGDPVLGVLRVELRLDWGDAVGRRLLSRQLVKLVPATELLEEEDGAVVLSDDLQMPSRGLSAYELALLHGYEGTEEEFALEYVRAREAAERAAAEASAAVEAAERAAAEASAAVEVSGRAAEQAGSALRLVDETVMRVYRDGGYNMDQCLWYGHWFGCVLGRPAGSAAGEMYDLDVVNAGSRVLFSALAEPVDFAARVRNVIGVEGGWAGTFGTYVVGVGDGHGRVEMFCERYYGNYPAAGEEVCRQRVKVPSGRYRLVMEVLGCCTRERDSWLAAPDVDGQAFSMRANGVEMAGCGGSRVLVATAVGDMGQVYSLVDSVEVTDGWLELVLYAGDARTANWFILRCVGLQQTDVAEEYLAVKQTCHSCLDVGRVFHRLVLTQDRNVFEAPTTLYGAWESVTAGLEARVRSLVADEATVEDVEALD